MTQANYGDTVKVHYIGKLDDGTVFDSSIQRDPLEFTIGQGQIIPGFEQAVVGMRAGELKTTSIPPEAAYGPHRDEMVIEVDLTFFPNNVNPEVGQQLQIHQPMVNLLLSPSLTCPTPALRSMRIIRWRAKI